jgi:hypothetical protein
VKIINELSPCDEIKNKQTSVPHTRLHDEVLNYDLGQSCLLPSLGVLLVFINLIMYNLFNDAVSRSGLGFI